MTDSMSKMSKKEKIALMKKLHKELEKESSSETGSSTSSTESSSEEVPKKATKRTTYKKSEKEVIASKREDIAEKAKKVTARELWDMIGLEVYEDYLRKVGTKPQLAEKYGITKYMVDQMVLRGKILS